MVLYSAFVRIEMNKYRDYDNYLKEYPSNDGWFGKYGGNFLKDPEGLPRYQRIVLTNLLFDCKARPDFIACKFEDRGVSSIRRTVDKLGVQEVCWTIRRMEDLKTCEAAGAIPIFEKFDPEG